MTELLIKGHTDYSKIISEFKREKGIHNIIGFSGGADDKIQGIDEGDELQIQYKTYQALLHERIITDTLKPLRNFKIAILTGGTRWGVPSTANRIAKSLGFTTIGVTPSVGSHHSLSKEEIDFRITVEPMIGDGYWGDEGAIWTTLVDGIVIIGGGAGTLTECAHIMKINEAMVKCNHIPKFMIPIHGTGGLAEQLQHLWAKPKIRDVSMPREQVHTGKQAADIIIDKLDLEYYY